MLPNEKNSQTLSSVSSSHSTQFKSASSVFISYLLIRAAPITAFVYYFSNWQAAFIVAILLCILIICFAMRNNHNFAIHNKQLIITPILFQWKKDKLIELDKMEKVMIKLSDDKDARQWLHFYDKDQQSDSLRYRCDWLHRQDPPEAEEDNHEHPEGELFDLLEDEDFYQGSAEHLIDLLRAEGINIEFI